MKSNSNTYIRKVAILGSGVMGAQIGAHFGNANIPVTLFDLKSASGSANAQAEKALLNLGRLHPNPLATSAVRDYLAVGNYDDDLSQLLECDLIIEAIAERLDWKVELFHKIAPYVNPQAILASNTSGLSIEELAASVPASLQANFCGIHFFNPPRYMPLVELIPHAKTDQAVIPTLETFLVSSLGKSVIEARDTPNFIANRIGVFSMMAILEHAQNYQIPFEVVDQLTGKNLGRAKSATFRTADVVGLDTFVHVVETMAQKCHDGFEHSYVIPAWLSQLIAAGQLGQKTKGGVFRKDSRGILVIDSATGEYRLADRKASSEVLEILQAKSWAERLARLHASAHPEAQFLWAIFRDLFHYCAVLLGEITDSIRDIDLALRWGFGWKEGAFEIWQQGGWLQIAEWIDADITGGKTISQRALPEWVSQQSVGVYADSKHYSYGAAKLVHLDLLPVYQRQIFPELLLGEQSNLQQQILYEDAGVKLWHSGDNIGVLSFKSKMCSIGVAVLNGLEQALEVAIKECQALVIWQEKDIFSVGANLEEFGFAIMMNGQAASDEIIAQGQRIITQKIRYSPIPVVAGVRGYAFGGGCEIMLHCDAVVAALESYIGLVEAGVGLIPAWGGSKEMLLRSQDSLNPWQDLTQRYQTLALAKFSSSAREAQELGFLRKSDTIVMNSREVLLIAKERARFLALSGYRPPLKPQLKAAGEDGIASLKGMLLNMFEGGQISAYDLKIAENLAQVMCGGAVTSGTTVSEDWLLQLEKTYFSQLATSDKTAERIQHMLATGKPLRN